MRTSEAGPRAPLFATGTIAGALPFCRIVPIARRPHLLRFAALRASETGPVVHQPAAKSIPLSSGAIGRTPAGCARHRRVGAHRRRRRGNVSRLRPRLGRLHPFAIWRPPGVALFVRLRRQARAVVRQSLHVRRRLRSLRRARRQNSAVRPVRDAPSGGRGGRHRRPVRHLAARPAAWRPARRSDRSHPSCHLSALLRTHVHQRQGWTVRGHQRHCAARHRARLRGISAGDAGDRSAMRHRRRACHRLARHGRLCGARRLAAAVVHCCRPIARERAQS